MARTPSVRSTDLDRVLKALAAAGQQVAGVKILPGGEIHILTGEPQAAPLSPLDAWREKNGRGGRAA